MSAVHAYDEAEMLAGFNAAGAALEAKYRKPRKPEPERRRTHQRVGRKSWLAGTERYEPMSRRQARRSAKAVEMYMLKTQAAGVRSGATPKWKAVDGPPPGETPPPLSYFDVNLYKLLCHAAVAFAGNVHPSYEWMAEKMTGVATRTKTVVASIKRLRAHGLVDVRRRYVEVDGAGHERGPQVEQTSNFYWVLPLPTIARQLLESWIRRRRGPAASDDVAAQQDAQEAQQARWAKEEGWEAGRASSPALKRADAKMAEALGVFLEELPEVAARLRVGKGQRDVP